MGSFDNDVTHLLVIGHIELSFQHWSVRFKTEATNTPAHGVSGRIWVYWTIPLHLHLCKTRDCFVMVHRIDLAVKYKRQNPCESYPSLGRRFEVPKSTLYDQVRGISASHGMSAPRLLSLEPQRVLIDKINGYATRGTLLTAPQVRAFAQAICGEHVGINGVGCFVERHKDVTPPTFFAYQEAARLKANTPKTRRAFYSLVCRIRPYASAKSTPADPRGVRNESISSIMHLQHG